MNAPYTILSQNLSPCRALIVAGAEGAAAPVDFEQLVHAPVNFDQWAHSPDNFQ